RGTAYAGGGGRVGCPSSRPCARRRAAANWMTMGDRSRAVISIIGRDQKGVVARVSTYLAAANVNIEDIEQRVMEGLFIMTMLVDLSDLAITLDELVLGLRAIGDEINMEVTVRLAGGPPTPKRVAVLVTREPHCLETMIDEREAGELKSGVG